LHDLDTKEYVVPKPLGADAFAPADDPRQQTIHMELQMCELLPKLATVMDRCVLVRSVTHTLAEQTIGANRYLEIRQDEKALDISDERDQLRKVYGGGMLAHSALAARRLIEAGVRFVTIGVESWDTHSENFSQLRYRLLPQFAVTKICVHAELTTQRQKTTYLRLRPSESWPSHRPSDVISVKSTPN
jgi:hypothetical protein